MWSRSCNLKSSTAWLWLAVYSCVLFPSASAQITVGPDAWTFNGPTDLIAVVGQTITFSWTGTHNVFIHPTGNCDETGAIEVGSTADAAGASYTFTAADVGSVVFACDVGTHCEVQAMIMTVSVSGGGEGTPSPTDRTDIPTRSPINVDPGPPTRSPIHVDPGPPQPTPPTKGKGKGKDPYVRYGKMGGKMSYSYGGGKMGGKMGNSYGGGKMDRSYGGEMGYSYGGKMGGGKMM